MRQLDSLDVWRAAQDLAHSAYLLTLDRLLSRHFALVDQVRRAAISVPANIAEGYALSTPPQFVRHLRIALGSAAELRSHLELARRLDLVPVVEAGETIALCLRVISMLVGLLRKLTGGTVSRSTFPVSRSGD
ncbi:MAG TPA: four helix bundle protein [Gemmatimonadales bacterium]|nr:four helix bundle protein [Gemmatimonadales bacterium]